MRTEKIVLKNKHIDEILSWLKEGTEIYNQSLYYLRQEFFQLRDELKKQNEKSEKKEKEKEKNHSLNYYSLYSLVQKTDAFKNSSLDFVVKQNVVKLACQNWKSFSAARKSWKANPSKFTGKPQLPKYLKNNKLANLTIDKSRLRKPKNKTDKSKVRFPKSQIELSLPTYLKRKSIRCIQLKKYYGKIKAFVVYDCQEEKLNLNKSNAIGIDIGLSNICAITTNNQERSWIVKGGAIKSINQFYNKKLAKMRSELELCNKRKTSKNIERLNRKRNDKLSNYFHNLSKSIIDICVENNVGTIVIGHNKEWKQNTKLGKTTTQNFIQIPFNQLIEMISYKGTNKGIDVLTTEESYTSKCDHLANETMKHHEEYLGKRIKRGLFRSSTGKILNADINGAIGILRKMNAISDIDLVKLRNRGDVVSPCILEIKC